MAKQHFCNEYRKKYGNSFILVRDCAGAEPYFMHLRYTGVDEEGEPLPFSKQTCFRGLCIKGGKKQKKEFNLSDFIVDLEPLAPGYYNNEYTKTAVLITRTNRRQWRRGTCPGETVTCIDTTGEYSLHELNPTIGQRLARGSNDIHYMSGLLQGGTYSFEGAVNNVVAGKYLSTAFSDSYAVGVNSMLKNNLAVYHKNKVIGLVDKKQSGYEVLLPENAQHFIEELSQYTRVTLKEF